MNPNLIKIAKQKTKSKTIFLDLDGVIVDWLGGAAKLFNFDEENSETRKQLKNGVYINEIDDIVESEEKMWEEIDKSGTYFWANLEMLPWATDLIKKVSNFGDVLFLTSPSYCPSAFSGKAIWIKEHFGEQFLKKTILASQKYYCAAKNRVLVDDSEHKVDDFRNYGGYAYRWPNQYSIIDGDVNLDYVFKTLIDMISRMD